MRFEPVLIQAAVAKLGIGALDERVVRRLRRPNEVELDTDFLCPEEYGFTGQFWTVFHRVCSSGDSFPISQVPGLEP